MERFTFMKLAELILSEENRALTALEIWEIAKEKGYDVRVGSKGKTPWKTIEAQIYTSLKDDKDTVFVKIKTKPIKFFLKNNINDYKGDSKAEKERTINKKFSYLEKDMHPFLAYYVYTYLRVFTKTISHEKSDNKRFTQWLHPDMVGAYFPIEDWEEEVLDFSKILGTATIRLYSFELKRELNFQNIRQSFFQAVSNSSWANEGYLVASQIDTDEEFLIELKRLSTSFGIGILKIDMMDPDSSQIIYPAKYKSELDWENINKLAVENPDFKEFLKRVKIDLNSKEIRKELYDKIYSNLYDLREVIK